ncbi:hypothetical protein [Primorskyibacter flagellatus]|uniref:Uncharacterized protein n=1 Tax=Primorskyibacter flagellatus TaxID=1387277 RepID=A0A1W2DDF3_9RHOB|nr:hypothetical protein [Primorskyibacter flagellatus]SMC95497.1 hypothetical protein SAMN06295998_1134 [Primorskyibacter flagellatus]
MTNICNSLSYDIRNQHGPRERQRRHLVLPEADHAQLQRHLEQCEGTQHPAWRLLAYVLRDKIMMTDPVSKLHVRDLVTGGCRVTYCVSNAESQTGLLVHRARAGAGSGVIPVASLLGATLIGMRAGQRAPLLCEDGSIMSVSVLDVMPPN